MTLVSDKDLTLIDSADAITAVEAEPTLDLTGLVGIGQARAEGALDVYRDAVDWVTVMDQDNVGGFGLKINTDAATSSQPLFRLANAANTLFDVLSNGAVTITNTLRLNNNVGFFNTAPQAQSAAYTPTNVTTDRSYDANATTLDEIADVLGTLIIDLQTYGLIG